MSYRLKPKEESLEEKCNLPHNLKIVDIIREYCVTIRPQGRWAYDEWIEPDDPYDVWRVEVKQKCTKCGYTVTSEKSGKKSDYEWH